MCDLIYYRNTADGFLIEYLLFLRDSFWAQKSQVIALSGFGTSYTLRFRMHNIASFSDSSLELYI
jgi:hypothetical protein